MPVTRRAECFSSKSNNSESWGVPAGRVIPALLGGHGVRPLTESMKFDIENSILGMFVCILLVLLFPDKFNNISLKLILSGNNEIILSLKKNYKNSYGKKILKLFKNKNDYRIVGMGGWILGANAIYDFLNDKIKKKFYFINNLQANHSKLFKKKL